MFNNLKKVFKVAKVLVSEMNLFFGSYKVDHKKIIRESFFSISKDLGITEKTVVCFGEIGDQRYKAVNVFRSLFYGMNLPEDIIPTEFVIGNENDIPGAKSVIVLSSRFFNKKYYRGFWKTYFLVQTLGHEMYHTLQERHGLMLVCGSTYGMNVKEHNSLYVEKQADRYGYRFAGTNIRRLISLCKKED